MRHFTLLAARASVVSAFLLAVSVQAGAAPLSPAGLSSQPSSIQLVQAKKKDETMKQKVKRVWRNMTGYKFDVGCPTLGIALNRTSCTETGKNVSEARSKCMSKHPLCEVAEKK